MENLDQTPNTSCVDKAIKSPEFYKNLQNEIESDRAQVQKNIQVLTMLRSKYLSSCNNKVIVIIIYLLSIVYKAINLISFKAIRN